MRIDVFLGREGKWSPIKSSHICKSSIIEYKKFFKASSGTEKTAHYRNHPIFLVEASNLSVEGEIKAYYEMVWQWHGARNLERVVL